MFHRAFLISSLLLAWHGVALAAGNFAFSVTAEPGLQLKMRAYDSKGGLIFDILAGPTQATGGGMVYTGIVDEAKIFASRPASWCIELVNGKSNTFKAGSVVCDPTPTETRGTYQFGLDRAVAGAPPLAGPSTTVGYGSADDFTYQVAPNVPPQEVIVIKTGLQLAEAYLDAKLGGGLPQSYRRKITVKIVATGKGNQEPGGGGGVATAFAGPKPRPFFDVANAQWNQDSRYRGWTTESDSMKTVAHEYGHVWQAFLGSISGNNHPMPDWMNEGIAEYVGYLVMIDSGRMDMAHVRPFVLHGAIETEMGVPLDKLRVWPGHAGFMALDWLLEDSPNGLMSLRILGEQVGKGKSFKTAFQTAFGISLADFYRQFESWRNVAVTNEAGALAARPKLAR